VRKAHRLELADVFRTHQHAFLARWNSVLSRQQRKVLRDIRDCQTAVLGGHLYECDRCGHRVNVFNSCRNRSCPKCQATARAKWLAQREAKLLPVPYFHVVFTLPQQIGRLAFQNQKQIYSILFQTAAETLLTIAADPRHLGASIGFLAVLHTWGQHLHCVAPGGFSPDGSRWIACRKDSFFLPYKVLSRLFRKLFLVSLGKAFRQGQLHLSGELRDLAKPAAFQALCETAAHLESVVHVKPPFGGPRRVLKYLARYTHRVAIFNHRLRSSVSADDSSSSDFSAPKPSWFRTPHDPRAALRPRALQRFCSEPQQISVSGRSATCREFSRHPAASVAFTLETAPPFSNLPVLLPHSAQ
jgi:hypothetical protein